LGLLNSSTACFWLKQVCHNKGSTVDQRGARQRTAPFEDFFQFNGTRVGQVPLPVSRPVERARRLDGLAQQLEESLPEAVAPTREALAAARTQAQALRAEMIAVQEELDWEVYGLYGLVDGDLTHPEPPRLALGQRAFEIVLARRVAAGEEQTTWFDRHRSTPITELPAHWPDDYRALAERRIALIESDRDLGLIERPECKRRWQWEPWESRQEQALRSWLLDRLEDARFWGGDPRLTSCARLADEARKDPELRAVAELYAGRADVDLARLVEELVVAEAVPYLAAWRHTDTGLRTRASWERTWALQRQEDAIDALCELPADDPRCLAPEQAKARKQVDVGTIPVPPKYTSKDYRNGAYWSLRGRLDVPNERFVLYPGCERAADTSPVIGWAGWNHLERAQALAQHLTALRTEDSWDATQLTPLLAGLAELMPWVLQWHNDH
ncbi:MAG: BREX-2 system adenine-specific DNA-methyltransferase PglX, partial [Burkholderiales bacterium]